MQHQRSAHLHDLFPRCSNRWNYLYSFCNTSISKLQLPALLSFMLLMLQVLPAAQAQTPSSVLANRISRVWHMQKLEESGKPVNSPDHTAGDFIMSLHADQTVEQGMYPDALIKGTWSVDEKERVLTVKDNETHIVYRMKIVKLTDTELVLQDQSSATGLTIYFTSK